MEQLFPFLGNWVWFVAAGIFLLLELLSPGVFFIWLGVAAALTGIADRFTTNENPEVAMRDTGAKSATVS